MQDGGGLQLQVEHNPGQKILRPSASEPLLVHNLSAPPPGLFGAFGLESEQQHQVDLHSTRDCCCLLPLLGSDFMPAEQSFAEQVDDEMKRFKNVTLVLLLLLL